MIKKETYTDSALPDPKRMLEYKTFAAAFSYPDNDFFRFFPDLSSEKEKLCVEYDQLFRASELWLYGTEYLAKNEFQRSNYLSDIMGFYMAFGLEPDKDRPDSITGELEFMHYLIHKGLYALKGNNVKDAKEKASICLDAQKKFFAAHLYPAAKKIAEAIISSAKGGSASGGSHKNSFYAEISKELLDFLESEKKSLGNKKI